jgi:hypothetical protein
MKGDLVLIYLDMDGVLMDYEGAIKAHNIKPYPEGAHWISKPRAEWPPAMVAADKAYVECMMLPTFWPSIKPLPDAHLLWQYARLFPTHVLTATPTDRPGEYKFSSIRNMIARQKRDSIWSNFDPTFPADCINICLRHEKASYAKPGSILVDDTPGNCQEWEAAGGVAILHKDALSTIRILQELSHVL